VKRRKYHGLVCKDCGKTFTGGNWRTSRCPRCAKKAEKCPECGGKKDRRSPMCRSCSLKKEWKDPVRGAGKRKALERYHRSRKASDVGRRSFTGRSGPKSPRWKGGKDRSQYHPRTESRNAMAERLRKRGCEECGMTNRQSLRKYGERLSLHHRNGSPTDDTEENIMILCKGCHCRAHHTKDRRPR
jgi:hypothetical protein